MEDNTINIFIGFDPNNNIEYHIASQSIIDQTSSPVNIIPLRLLDSSGKKFETKDVEYSKARFQVPFLSDFKGWSLYVDCDFVFNEDIAELWKLRNDKYSVMVVKHKHKRKYEYPEMYWSSMMLFNNKKCHNLTLDYINKHSTEELDTFCWLDQSIDLGELPPDWHILCHNDAETSENDKAFHFMQGAPWERSVFDQGTNNEIWNFYARKLLKDLNFLNTAQDYSIAIAEDQPTGGSIIIEEEELILVKGSIIGLSGLQVLNEDGVRHFLIENGHLINGYYSSIPITQLLYLGIKIINEFTKLSIETDFVSFLESEFLMIRDFDNIDFKNLEQLELEYEKLIFLLARFIIGSTHTPLRLVYPMSLSIKDIEFDQYCFGLDLFSKNYKSSDSLSNFDKKIIKKICENIDLKKRIFTEIEAVAFFDNPTKKLCIDYIINRFEILERLIIPSI